MWFRAGSELSPDKSLSQIQGTSRFLLSSVAIVGTLLTGFGLIAPDAVRRVTLLFVVALILTLASLLLALFALILRNVKLDLQDLTAVEAWYGRQLKWRGWAATLSGIALALAILTAGAGGLAVSAPEAAVSAAARFTTVGSQPIVSVDVHFDGMPRDSQAMFSLVGIDGAGVKTTVSTGIATPQADGTAELGSNTPDVAAYGSYVLTAAIDSHGNHIASTSVMLKR